MGQPAPSRMPSAPQLGGSTAAFISVTTPLCRNAQQFPKALATLDVPSGRRQTWAGLLSRVARLAQVLTSAPLALKKGDRLAILAFNSDAYFELLFACAWAGIISVPLNFRLTPEELKHVLLDSGAALLCLDEAFAKSTWPQLKPLVPATLATCLMGDGDVNAVLAGSQSLSSLLEKTTVEKPDAQCGGDDVVTLCYTGGTTGKAKGVMLTHCNIMFNALGTLHANRFNLATRFLHVAPMFHLADGQMVFANTLGGGAHIFVPRFAPLDLLPTITAHKATKVVMVPMMIQMVLNLPNIEELAKPLKDHEIEILYGGSAMAPALMESLLKLFPKVRLFQGFGMTETSPAISFMDHEMHSDPTKLSTVGRPVAWVHVRIVDENDADVPQGKTGEIIVKGPNVMKGYWNMPELTKTTLRGGYMHTGDGGHFDADGFLVLGDRLKDMIKTGGENVFSMEVEKILSSMPELAMNAVIGLPDASFGEIVVAVVVPKTKGAEITAEQVKAHCQKQGLAGYKIPKRVICKESLPMSGPGKILKQQIRQELGVAQADASAAQQKSTYA